MGHPQRLRRMRTVAAGFAGGTLLIGGLALASAPAAQAASISGFGSGPIGVPQLITMSGVCDQFGASLSFAATYSDGVVATTSPVTADASGSATVYWTPSRLGTVTQVSVGSTCAPVTQATNFSITPVATVTSITAPNTAQVGVATKIQAIVTSQSPSTYTPSGTVTITDPSGAVITTMGLTPGPGTAQAYAYYWWTPSAPGSYIIQARYNPATGNALTSVSAQDIIQATASGGTISLFHPPVMYVGAATTLTATVAPASTQGSVGFTINGQPISASIPLVNGQASFVWTPQAAGPVRIGASYTTNQGGSGSTFDNVVIQAPAKTDSITLTPAGQGTWAPNGSYPVGNGTTLNFSATTLSGAAVTLTDTGPCTISGLSLTATQGSGGCILTATSPGGNGYAGIAQNYTIQLVPGTQVPRVQPRQSGPIKRGAKVTLEGPGNNDTNAGQNMSWKVTSGKANCKLRFPSNGSVRLEAVKAGSCNVRATAPGVPGQWNNLVINRSFNVRN
jgi:hypothetical protein